MADPETIKERMLQGFLPAENLTTELRTPRALEYIAFYLVEINAKLGEVVDLMKKE